MVKTRGIQGFPNVKVIRPSGEIDRRNYQQFYLEALSFVEELRANPNYTPIYLVIDLQDIKVIDGKGLGALIKLLKKLRKDGSQLALCSVNSSIEIMLRLTATYNIFNVLPSGQGFFKKLRSGQSSPLANENSPPPLFNLQNNHGSLPLSA